ncbi:Zn dependent hydrolase or glyoxylase [Ectocarpus siliculosus]|uniref:Zn dependent hydrolase or glyoxylase n=1 Tax=Ectocarpus siliculosus TaxID=2880 RepID=D7FQG3_ECTSI|nr:Zn dependent hydrolase or glyoxylase [Ectocarpus siliculosus]|eukprot:CBJ48495.1 Zn dependent hydrolase or glyoxylase [Ectocarpus siliculosus]
MAYLLSSASFLASAFVSNVLQFVSRSIRASPLLHQAVKVLDRGKSKVPRGMPHVAPWAVESDLVVRMLALNPGMHTLQGTNCYLVGNGARRILIDTGEGKAGFVPHLLDVMRQAGCEMLDAILLTHWHVDHVGGVNDIRKALGGNIPVFKKYGPTVQDFDYSGIEDGQLFRTTGATLEAVSTPGHTEDHVAFVLHEEKALFTGDMILGCGTAIFDDFASYMDSLQRVRDMSPKYEGGFTRLYCGHGPAVEAAQEKIEYYIKHRQEREAQIINALTAAKGRTLSALQITVRVYGVLPLPIFVSAHYNVLHHLSKLAREGRAVLGWVPCSYYLGPERGLNVGCTD